MRIVNLNFARKENSGELKKSADLFLAAAINSNTSAPENTASLEEWREVVGYEGDYEVSNLGRVRSFVRGAQGRILRPKRRGSGHLYVQLRRNIRAVHHLVMEAFYGARLGRRDKGNRTERAIVRLLQAQGFATTKISGMYKPGADVSVPLAGRNLDVEVKYRAAGFETLYRWLIACDGLIIKTDRKEPLLVIRLSLACEIAGGER